MIRFLLSDFFLDMDLNIDRKSVGEGFSLLKRSKNNRTVSRKPARSRIVRDQSIRNTDREYPKNLYLNRIKETMSSVLTEVAFITLSRSEMLVYRHMPR